MRYVIGVEGTQAGMTAAAADATGCVLGICHGPALPSLREGNGHEAARRVIAEVIQSVIVMADLQNARFAAACVGVGEEMEVLEGLCVPVIPAERLLFAPPARLALAAIAPGRPGVAAFAGIGATVCGLNAEQALVTTGGWAGASGEEGSSVWIVYRALNACCRAVDGIGPETKILPLLLVHLETMDFRTAYCRIIAGPMSAARVTALIEVIRLAAKQGDATAQRILREAGRELGLAVSATLRRLGMQDGQPTVGTAGEVFQGRLVLRSFREVVQRTAAGAVITSPKVPLAVGAAALALEALGVELTEEVRARLLRTTR
jgi:N-acetylglucosamine kinase-like BadF-type ATPase